MAAALVTRRGSGGDRLDRAGDARTHALLSAGVTRGPTQDAPHLLPAARTTRIDTPLGRAGYDAEGYHATCRTRLGIRSTVIA